MSCIGANINILNNTLEIFHLKFLFYEKISILVHVKLVLTQNCIAKTYMSKTI